MQLGTGSKVMLPLPPPGGRSLLAGRRMSVGVPTDRSDWPTFTEMHEEKTVTIFVVLFASERRDETMKRTGDGRIAAFCPFFVFDFFSYVLFFFLQNVKLFVVKKSSSCACV